jgi:hypothetical protein
MVRIIFLDIIMVVEKLEKMWEEGRNIPFEVLFI